MGFFRKPPRKVTPVSTPMTASWFDAYFQSILADSGVQEDDGQNLVQITWFALEMQIDDVAHKAFAAMEDPDALQQYTQLVSTGAGPADRVSFLVGWNSQLLDVLRSRLDSNRELMVKAGRMHGRFRFVSSKCCGQPVEISLTDGTPYCSSCRTPT